MPPKNAKKSSKHQNFDFIDMKIPEGSPLISTKTGETAETIDDRKVRFHDEVMSLTAATKKDREKDTTPETTRSWTYNGRNLRDIYRETYR